MDITFLFSGKNEQPDFSGMRMGGYNQDNQTGLVREEEVPLSQLIEIVNQRFGTDFTQADQLFFDQIVEAAVTDDGLRQASSS